MPMKNPAIPTTRDCCRKFLKKCGAKVTKDLYAGVQEEWLTSLGSKADLGVDQLSPADYWTFEQSGQSHLKPATRARNLQAVRGVIKVAIKDHYLPPDFLKPGATPAKRGSSKPVRRKKPTVTAPTAPASTATGRSARILAPVTSGERSRHWQSTW